MLPAVCLLSHFRRVRVFVTYGFYPFRLLYPQDSPGKNTGVSCHALPLPPGDLPDSRIEPKSLMSPALVGGFFSISVTWEAVAV